MRVLSPERIAAIQAVPDHVMGLPLGGEWIKVPDYFLQVTEHQEENDVIHAKLVDGMGSSYLTSDLLVDYPGEPEPRAFEQYYYYGQHSYLSINQYSLVKKMVQLPPSPKYKGKKRKVKYVERDIRVSDPLAITFLVSSHTEQRGLFTYQCWRLSGRIYAFKTDNYNPGDSSSAELVYQEFFIDSQLDFSAFPIVSSIYSVRERTSGRDCFTHPAIHSILSSWAELPTKSEDHESELSRARAIATQSLRYGVSDAATWLRNFGYATTAPLCSCHAVPFPELPLQKSFIMNEPAWMTQRSDPLLAGMMSGLSTFWIDKLTQNALLEACNSLPRLNDNTISNLIELVGFVKSLVVDHKVEIPKSLSSSWLSYRYQYNTTKLDVEEAIKFVSRHTDLGSLDRNLRGHSVVHHMVHGTDVTCRCSIEVGPKDYETFATIWRALDRYGLTPDFYVIWDMIPYSFMVDWFLPISDIAAVMDANRMYFSGDFYKFSKIVYSITYTRELDDRNVKCYTRWKGEVPSSLNGIYWFDAPSASNKTVGYRVLDTASIFIG